MSYRRKHVKSKIYKIRPKKSIFTKPWFWIVFLFLAIVLSVFYFFLFFPGIQAKNIVISGNQKSARQDIENLISAGINNKILGIGNWEVNSKSIFLVDSDKLARQILNKFPIVENVKIGKKLPQTLIVNITEREPVGVYCPADNNCFFIDQTGIIFESLPAVPDNFTVVRQVINNEQIFVGEKVVQQNIMDLLLKVEKNLKDNFQINLTEALVTSPLRLDLSTNENWKIYFDLSPDADFNSQLIKLNSLLGGGISAGERKNLRYINLIPKDRAIICDNKTCEGR